MHIDSYTFMQYIYTNMQACMQTARQAVYRLQILMASMAGGWAATRHKKTSWLMELLRDKLSQ